MVDFNELSTTDKINFMGQVMVLIGTACIAYSNIMKAINALPNTAMYGVPTVGSGSNIQNQPSASNYLF